MGLTSRACRLFVGRLTPEKKPLTFVTAYRQLSSSMPLTIIGDDPYDKGYAKRLRRAADERVRFDFPIYMEPDCRDACPSLSYPFLHAVTGQTIKKSGALSEHRSLSA
jgi:glycosyltransferase involved in cell wall biosynthesis